LISIFLSAILGGYGSIHCVLNFLFYPCIISKFTLILEKIEDKLLKLKNKQIIVEEEIYNLDNQLNTMEEARTNKSNLMDSIKSVFKSKDVDNHQLRKEFDILNSDLCMQIQILKERPIIQLTELQSSSSNILVKMKYIIQIFFGKVLGLYCVYKIIITFKNLLFTDYNGINVMLREELLNIIDFSLSLFLKLMNLKFEEFYYTVIEQYFSLIIVGTIIIVNIRSFLNTIWFIYQKIFKDYEREENKHVQMLTLSYFVGLFYICSSIFLIFNLPKTYRKEMVKVYGNLDYSLLKYYYDKTFFLAVVMSTVMEYVYMNFI
jgi:hypothetical protein